MGTTPRRSWIIPVLGSGLWQAYEAAGSIEMIEDASLIREVSRAYDRIALTAYLEQRLYEMVFFTGRSNPGRLTVDGEDVHTLDHIRRQDEHTKAAIEYALQLIREDGARRD